MDLWRGSLAEFIRSAESGAIAGDLSGRFVKVYDRLPAPGEMRSWANSLPRLAAALRPVGRSDLGVALGTVAERPAGETRGAHAEVGVAAEYHLPLSGKRLDVLLCGRGVDGRRRGLVVELKQWSSVGLEGEFETNVLVDGEEHLHPSEQALAYSEWLADYHSAFADGDIDAAACSYVHNMGGAGADVLRDPRFGDLLARSPLYCAADEEALARMTARSVGGGDGLRTMESIAGGAFRPARNVLARLEEVLRKDGRWHLIGEQRLAYNAILAEVRRLGAGAGHAVVLVRGAPGTGKSVIAVQILADALRLGLRAAHVTGGKAFTTALRAQFRGADGIFQWNMNVRDAPTQGIDVLLVDEAHRVRQTSETRWTRASGRTGRAQVDELIDASKVAVFLLDDNQSVRPDEIGSSKLVEDAARRRRLPLRSYDLETQFRCGGCVEYIAWVDHLLGFAPEGRGPWRGRYRFALADAPADLDALLATGGSARVVAGFCWPWSDATPDGSLVRDVTIGDWSRPWNAKEVRGKRYTPKTHPYTLWAETDAGREQIGCIYSAQGFEFERVGVIWGPDLVRRGDAWVAQRGESHDRMVRASPAMAQLVRNAYRVLLTRGIAETRLLCLDAETRDYVKSRAG